MTTVSKVPAALSIDAQTYFEAMLGYETDCWDVHHAITHEEPDFILLDVRSSELFAAGHITTAKNIMHGKLTKFRLKDIPQEMLFVVYCAGPHCNGANKAAVHLARLGRPVKLMIGGIEGWKDEGFDLATGAG